jgi:hypothetical protein
VEEEYRELRISRINFFKGVVFSIVSTALIIYCLIESPGEYIVLILFFAFMLVYGLYCALEQANWYIRYDEKSFEVRNFMGKVKAHSFDEIKAIKPLRKGAAIISMKSSKRQYEVEPKINGAEDFFETFRAYCNRK